MIMTINTKNVYISLIIEFQTILLAYYLYNTIIDVLPYLVLPLSLYITPYYILFGTYLLLSCIYFYLFSMMPAVFLSNYHEIGHTSRSFNCPFDIFQNTTSKY